MAGRLFILILLACASGGLGDTPPMQPYDVIVVGLGSAGTTAASTLARAGRRVLALDAQAYVGGRVHTVPFADGIVEVGAEWIHGTKPSRVYDAAIENNITLLSQGFHPMAYRSDGSLPDTELVTEMINCCLNIIEHPPKDPEPLGQFITRKLKDYLIEKRPAVLEDKEFMEQFLDYLNLLMNNYEASNDWNDVGTTSEYEDLEGDQHMSWHRNGYKTFFEILLNKYNNGPGLPTLEIQLNKEVKQVSWPQEPTQQVTVTCTDGTVYSSQTAIVTVSLGVLKERHTTLFTPKLPQEKITAIDNVAMGVVGKLIMSWKEPWWPIDKTIYAFIWKKTDRENVETEDYWTTRIFGATTSMGARNALTLWTSGDVAMLVETLPEDVVKRKCTDMLRKFMGANITIPEPTAIIRSTWFTNPYTRGSYTYDRVGVAPGLRAVLGTPLVDSAGSPRLLFAGEATNPVHFSTVHGASESGYREAMRLLNITSKI